MAEVAGGEMVKSCCAVGCTKRSVKGCGVSFYRFPADVSRRNSWITAINRKNWQPSEYSWLCSSHFISGSKSDDPLSPDYIPSQFEHVASPAKRKRKNELEAYKRRKRVRLSRREAALREEAAVSLLQLCTRVDSEDATTSSMRTNNGEEATQHIDDDEAISSSLCTNEVSTHSSSLCTSATLSTSDVGTETDVSFQQFEMECCALRKENQELRDIVEMSMNSFESDNKKMKFYTGIESFGALKAIFNLIQPSIKDHPLSHLSKFSQFVMVIMKLRLNLSNEDLGYRFGVSQSTVSKYWTKMIDIMYTRLKPLIKWPEREELWRTMPLAFKKHFSKCVCIIDCFELFCERPSDLMARAQTYSQYKHHNTVKFLIGISPQGVISYVSKGWGGRASDKYITENCGILNHILPGDQILADRGFTVQESVGFYCAEIKIPPFTRGKKQLSRIEVDTARQLSRVRIHVERVIGLLRNKYTILQSILPIKMIMCNDGEDSIIDKIVIICSALCNCSKSVIPFD